MKHGFVVMSNGKMMVTLDGLVKMMGMRDNMMNGFKEKRWKKEYR
jgi:hypothetical protein